MSKTNSKLRKSVTLASVISVEYFIYYLFSKNVSKNQLRLTAFLKQIENYWQTSILNFLPSVFTPIQPRAMNISSPIILIIYKRQFEDS
jgi:hypothetical protein